MACTASGFCLCTSLHWCSTVCGGAGCGPKAGMTQSSSTMPVVQPGCSKCVPQRLPLVQL